MMCVFALAMCVFTYVCVYVCVCVCVCISQVCITAVGGFSDNKVVSLNGIMLL